MEKNSIIESLNKGVPVYAPLIIRHQDLMANSNNKEQLKKVITTSFEKYMEYLRNIAVNGDINIFLTMMIIVDEETLEKKLIFSPSGFISSILYNLNYQNVCNEIEANKLISIESHHMMDKLKQEMQGRINALLNIKSKKQLMREFPFLYSKYETQRECSQFLKSLNRKLSNLKATEREKIIKDFEKEQRKTIPNFNFEEYLTQYKNITLDTFLEENAKNLTLLIEHIKEVIEYLKTSYINLDELGQDDKDKLELFFASQYLMEVERTTHEKKQDYLYYVSNYFAEHKDVIDSDLFVTLGSIPEEIPNYSQIRKNNGYILTPRKLYERYRQILIDNPNLRAIDFSHLDFTGLTASEVKEFMDEYLKDLAAKWDLLEPDDRSYEEEIIKKIEKTGTELSEDERKKHQKRLLELFMQKKTLYDSSDPFFRIKGKSTFDGYIGYIYKNGRVVLDKFYDDAESGKLADGHAVYAMSIQEFYEISKFSKTEIIRKKLCNRYIHTGNWCERVLQREINAPAQDNPVATVRKILKKGDVTG